MARRVAYACLVAQALALAPSRRVAQALALAPSRRVATFALG